MPTAAANASAARSGNAAPRAAARSAASRSATSRSAARKSAFGKAASDKPLPGKAATRKGAAPTAVPGDAEPIHRPTSSPRTIPEQIADDVGMSIVDGHYPDGARLTEQELASQFGVSRGPVRDALRLLARRGLLEMIPRRGNYVKSVSLNGIADLFNVRNALAACGARAMAIKPIDSYLGTLDKRIAELEQMVAQPSLDPSLFAYASTRAVAAITKGSGNDLLATMMTDLANMSVWNAVWKHPLDFITPSRRGAVCKQFRELQHAIAQRKPELAEQRIRSLLEDIRDHSIKTLRGMRAESVAPDKLSRSDRGASGGRDAARK